MRLHCLSPCVRQKNSGRRKQRDPSRVLTVIPGNAILSLPDLRRASGHPFRGPFFFCCLLLVFLLCTYIIGHRCRWPSTETCQLTSIRSPIAVFGEIPIYKIGQRSFHKGRESTFLPFVHRNPDAIWLKNRLTEGCAVGAL